MEELVEGIIPMNFSWRANNNIQQYNTQIQTSSTIPNKGEFYASLAGAITLIIEDFGNRRVTNNNDIIILRSSITNKIHERINPYRQYIQGDFINYYLNYSTFYNEVITKDFIMELLDNLVKSTQRDVMINEGM